MDLSKSVLLLLLLLLLTFFTFPPPSSSTSISFRAELTHIDSARSRSDRISRAARRSELRSATLSSRAATTSVHPSHGEYLLDLSIGTPPLPITGILDTGSDLIWTQCSTSISSLPQPSPHFHPLASSSFSPIPCAHSLCRTLSLDNNSACASGSCIYYYLYGSGTSVGFLGSETLTLGQASIPHVGFGCGLINTGNFHNSSGIIGFGLSPISLVSQLRANAFSYCFTEAYVDDSTKSPLFFGTLARLTGPNVRSTPFVKVNPALRLTYYYVSLLGITVGKTALAIPTEAFRLKSDGSGGMIVDSGTTFTQLVPEAYGPLARAIEAQVKLPKVKGGVEGLKLCFIVKERDLEAAFPTVVFHFEGADWELPVRNYMLNIDDEEACLAAQESSGMSMFGNFQTQNMHVLYDLKNYRLSFVPAKCHQL